MGRREGAADPDARHSPALDRELGWLYAQHLGVLIGGASLGALLALVVGGIPIDFSAEIARARELGIVSKTILAGYPKSRDLVNALSVVGLPVLVAFAGWLVWSRRDRSRLRALLSHPDPPRTPSSGLRRWLVPALVASIGLVLTFNINVFYRPGFNAHVGAWIFLGEQGELLEWAGRTLQGQVFGRDYFCLYGPMLIYPLAAALKIFGTNVVVARVYSYALNLVGYAIGIFFLDRTLRTRTGFALSSLVFLLAFNMLYSFTANTTLLRAALGVLPLLLMHLNHAKPQTALVVAAGAVAGQSLLFSQEIGLCCLATLGLWVGLELLLERDLPRAAREAGLLLASVCASVAPFAVYLALHGALGAALESLYGFPRLATLGFGSLPFPSFRAFVAHPIASGAVFHYWVIGVYGVSLLGLLPRLWLGVRDPRLPLEGALTVFGLLIFRIALGRSGEVNVFRSALPAFLLCFLHLERAARVALRGRPRALRIGGAAQATVWALSLGGLFAGSPYLESRLVAQLHDLAHASGKLTLVESGRSLPTLERAGVFVDDTTARSIDQIQDFLSANTRPGEYVYFFPNEAIYYFLFDRRNPTRYALSYFAISRQQRLELVRELEDKKPRYVVFSPRTWRVDGIPEAIQVPEVVAYLRRHYRPVRSSPDVVFLERVDG